MKILILNSKSDAVHRAATLIANTVLQNPKAVLGLATGGTMVDLYQALIRECARTALSFTGTKTFNLDEYVGLCPTHPASYRTYMNDCLFNHIDVTPENAHLPKGDAQDATAEADRYENLIQTSGGIDLQLLGIGQNGHIGFNEPSSSLTSRTRIKTLTASTRAANMQYFDGLETTPELAITMGVATILDARECLLLATGENKANAIAAMIEGPLSASCPASALQLHQKTTVIIDQEAAMLLKMRDYYKFVHPEQPHGA